MITATDFVQKTLKGILGLPIVDEYYFRKYKISKNIFSIYNKPDNKVTHLGKRAAEALAIILVTEIQENPNRELLLMTYMNIFLSEIEKEHIGTEPSTVIPYVISKFVQQVSTFEVFNLLEKGYYGKYNQLKRVFSSRAMMYDEISFYNLLKNANKIEAIGISINELTIKFDKLTFMNLIKSGTQIDLLFLDPESENTKLREQEELLPKGQIKNMTLINLNYIKDIMQKLNNPVNLKVHTYDTIPRLNMIFIDDKHLILQNYIVFTRGEDCPCYYIENDVGEGIYQFYHDIYKKFKENTKTFEAT